MLGSGGFSRMITLYQIRTQSLFMCFRSESGLEARAVTGRVYFSFAPSRHSPRAPLAPSHSRFENSKHINSDWVRFWRYTGFIISNYLAVPQKLQSTISISCFVAVTLVCILTVIVLLYLSLIKGFPNCCNQVWLKFGTLFMVS